MHIKYDGSLKISTARSRTATKWKNKTIQWSELLQQLSSTTRTRETLAEYRKLPKTKQDEIKDVGGFVGGWLGDGRRKAENLSNRTLLTLDADFATLGLLGDVEMYYGCAACVYSTHKHTATEPRLRLLVPLSRPLSGDEYEAAARMLAQDIGMDLFDDTTYQPTRLMYWPSTSIDADYVFDYVDGPWLDPDTLLARYPDWRDVSYWPESSRAASARKKTADKQGDPTAKPGIVGAFCRAYTIEAAIETFLADKYLPCALEGRYTYAAGSTAAGLVVYDGGLFAYSNHATDPASGRLCNAFDLVRLHIFGARDADTPEDTPINRFPSYKAMTELAAKDSTVRTLLGEERLALAREAFGAPADADEDTSWIKKMDVDKQGNPESTIENVVLILTHDPVLRGAVGFNRFRERLVLRQDLPWHAVRDAANGDVWTDADDSELRRYIEKIYSITGKDRIYDGTVVAANRNAFHPVRNYLERIIWDGRPRLDTLLIDYLGAEDTPYVRAATRKAFVAAVRRIYRPGCKFDYVLVLSGPQGRGKSSLIGRMGMGWYTDSLSGIGTKEAFEGIQGFWLVELGELSAMRKVDIEATKNFISKQCDSYRAAYGRRTEDHKRQCIFIGTTNSTTFLRDDTGNRRFWPIRLQVNEPLLTVWDDLTDETVAQVWAEAVQLERSGEHLVLPRELEAVAREQQAAFTEDDPRAGQIQLYLDTLLPADWESKDLANRRFWLSDALGEREAGTVQRQRVCISEIWQECFGKDKGLLKRQDVGELRAIMRQMPGWEEPAEKLWIGKEYGPQRCFVRLADR